MMDTPKTGSGRDTKLLLVAVHVFQTLVAPKVSDTDSIGNLRKGTVCSLSVGHSESRRMTDELGSRQRDLSTSSVTKRANGHWHAIIASSCRWSQREYKRQPVHRINHPFAEEPSGGVHYCSSWRYEKLHECGGYGTAAVVAVSRRTTIREDSHTGVCGGQLPCVLQH